MVVVVARVVPHLCNAPVSHVRALFGYQSLYVLGGIQVVHCLRLCPCELWRCPGLKRESRVELLRGTDGWIVVRPGSEKLACSLPHSNDGFFF